MPPQEPEFTVRQVARSSGPAANYNYEICCGQVCVARYWHDFRGDYHGIVFLDGSSDDWPVGTMTQFLEGGGPQPLRLSPAAVAYLKSKTRR